MHEVSQCDASTQRGLSALHLVARATPSQYLTDPELAAVLELRALRLLRREFGGLQVVSDGRKRHRPAAQGDGSVPNGGDASDLARLAADAGGWSDGDSGRYAPGVFT